MSDFYIKYFNLFYNGFTAHIDNHDKNLFEDNPYVKSLYKDVRIARQKNEFDIETIQNKFIVTVNGYLHRTAIRDSQLYVLNATSTMLRSGDNHLGLLMLRSLSDPKNIEIQTLRNEDIEEDPNVSFYDKCYLRFEKPLKTPILSFLGYMLLPNDEYFYPISEHIYVLKLSKISLLDKLYELHKYRDVMKEFDIHVSPNNPSMFDIEQATSESVIRKMLTSYNTFVVETHYNAIVEEELYLEHSNIPCTFRTSLSPNYPLVGGVGKLLEYHYENGYDGYYNVFTEDSFYNNYLLSRTPTRYVKNFNAHRQVGSTYYLSRAFFLKLNTE